MKLRLAALGALLALALASPTGVLAQDIAKGEKNFKKCIACHSIEEGGKNKTGPNLWNIMNRGTAQADYKYSKQFLAWAEENPVWTPELMDAWLENSKKLVKGTKMAFKEKKEDKRADLIAYLQSMGVEVDG